MMHTNRAWCVARVDSAEQLVEKLTQYSWCCCTGFELGNYLWLNDATSEDGAQEYSCVRKPTEDDPHYRQVESITVSWCKPRELIGYIESIHGEAEPPSIDSGPVVVARSNSDVVAALGDQSQPKHIVVKPRIETPEQHGRCPYCA